MARYAIGLLPPHTVVLFNALYLGAFFFACVNQSCNCGIESLRIASYKLVMNTDCGTIVPLAE